MHSVISDCTEAVEFLLKAGADPNHHSAINGMSCLATASVIGATKVAKLLIDAGASVDLLVHIDIETTSLILTCKLLPNYSIPYYFECSLQHQPLIKT